MKPPTHPDEAKKNLPLFGRLFLREHKGDLWEDETMTLPWTLRRMRRKYKAFADERIRPLELEVDLDVSKLDKDGLFKDYAKLGYATELLPWPIGTLPLPCVLGWYGVPLALKIEEITAACGGIGLMLGAHELGFAPLVLSGSPSVLTKWVIPTYAALKRGEKKLFAFAITEPGAGSDVEETEGAMKAKVVTRAKKVSGGYVINGRKVFISDGGIADYVTLFACLGNEGVESWTCFLLERGMKGFTLGRKEKKMGQKAGDATELVLEDVFVPDDHRIGPEKSGWALNRSVLNTSRPGVGAIALGISRSAFEHCLDFCRTTRLGNKRLVEYQDIQIELADMLIKIFAARALVWSTVKRFIPPMAAASAVTKVFASDASVAVCEKAMEIMGDHGYMHGRGVEKALRDARLTQIYEGTNQINRLGIIEDLWDNDIGV